MRRLLEECRTKRRTVADVLDVVRQVLSLEDPPQGQINLGPLRLPSGEWTALVDVVFPGLDCIVSLPTSARFQARKGSASQPSIFDIYRLQGAQVFSDGTVLLADGSRLLAVEVLPTHLPYEPSALDEKILRYVISMTGSDYCYRNIREGLPEHLRTQVPDLRLLDYSQVRTIEAPLLKLIEAHIGYHEPALRISKQKIADALARFGVRVPRRRPRRATI